MCLARAPIGTWQMIRLIMTDGMPLGTRIALVIEEAL
jgi:hypothetical protein